MTAPIQRLSPLDASFLYLEKPHQRLHVGCLALLDGPVPFDGFASAMAERLGRIPRYRQRPVRPLLDLGWPYWEEDPQFDVHRHLRHVAVPPPGDDAALHALVDALFATPLDPDHPLWETYFIDGLARGRAAVLCKIHHAMIDGVSGAQLLEVMSDSPPRVEPRPQRERPAIKTGGSLLSAMRPATLLGHARDAWQMIGMFAQLVREPGSTLPFNAPISDARRIVWASFPLDDFLVARGAAECKMNDVVLAVISGALRRWLEGRGVRPDALCVRTLVPVSIRGAEDHMTLGNLVTAMIARLPIDAADPLDRLRRVSAEMRTLKEDGQARATGLALQLTGLLPPAVNAVMARMLPSAGPLNTVTTNVPGPREAGRMLGRRIDEVHPIVPLFDGMGIEFAIMSYADRLSICAVADPRLVPDASDLAAHLQASADELQEALGLRKPKVVAEAIAPAVATPRVADLMNADVVTLALNDSVATAWAHMRQHRIRHLPVVTTEGQLVGIVTHRDLLAASASSLEEPAVREHTSILLAAARVLDVMEPHVSTVLPDDPAALAGERMIRHKIGCLPVVRHDGRLVGILTGDDFLRWATERMHPAPPMRASA